MGARRDGVEFRARPASSDPWQIRYVSLLFWRFPPARGVSAEAQWIARSVQAVRRGAFRKKVDAAGITQILQETPRIKVYDHDHAYGFHLGKMEYAVFADWDSGRLCRDVSLEEGTRQPRITDFDHDDALNEMVDCLARMLAAIEAGGVL